MTGPRARRWRGRLLALGIGLASSAAVVAGLEARARRAEGASNIVLPWDEPGRKYALSPATPNHNAGGFHDAPLPGERRAGVPRVVVAGDSVSYGGGLRVEEVYPRVAQSLLEREGREIEVVNLSVLGYDVEQVRATLRSRGRPLQPDLVVYAWFTNDHIPSDLINIGPGGPAIYVGTTLRADGTFLPLPAARWLLRRSAAFRRLQAAWTARDQARGKGRGPEAEGARDAWFRAQLDGLVADVAEQGAELLVFALGLHVLAAPDRGWCAESRDRSIFCAAQRSTPRRFGAPTPRAATAASSVPRSRTAWAGCRRWRGREAFPSTTRRRPTAPRAKTPSSSPAATTPTTRTPRDTRSSAGLWRRCCAPGLRGVGSRPPPRPTRHPRRRQEPPQVQT